MKKSFILSALLASSVSLFAADSTVDANRDLNKFDGSTPSTRNYETDADKNTFFNWGDETDAPAKTDSDRWGDSDSSWGKDSRWNDTSKWGNSSNYSEAYRSEFGNATPTMPYTDSNVNALRYKDAPNAPINSNQNTLQYRGEPKSNCPYSGKRDLAPNSSFNYNADPRLDKKAADVRDRGYMYDAEKDADMDRDSKWWNPSQWGDDRDDQNADWNR